MGDLQRCHAAEKQKIFDKLKIETTLTCLKKKGTLKIPDMDKVRLEVRETSRNSEKPKPKASKPPILSVKSEYRRGESSFTRNNFAEVLRLSPGNKTQRRLYNDVSMGWL